jgi:hypothetical protein
MNLAFEPIKTLQGQFLVDFIVEHRINIEDEISYVTYASWKIYFDGSTCEEDRSRCSHSHRLV